MTVIIFDLDDTLVDATRLFVGVYNALKELHEAKYMLVIASHNSTVERVLAETGIAQYFSYIESGCDTPFSKKRHLDNIMKKYGPPKTTAYIFVDDTAIFLEEAKTLGVQYTVLASAWHKKLLMNMDALDALLEPAEAHGF